MQPGLVSGRPDIHIYQDGLPRSRSHRKQENQTKSPNASQGKGKSKSCSCSRSPGARSGSGSGSGPNRTTTTDSTRRKRQRRRQQRRGFLRPPNRNQINRRTQSPNPRAAPRSPRLHATRARGRQEDRPGTHAAVPGRDSAHGQVGAVDALACFVCFAWGGLSIQGLLIFGLLFCLCAGFFRGLLIDQYSSKKRRRKQRRPWISPPLKNPVKELSQAAVNQGILRHLPQHPHRRLLAPHGNKNMIMKIAADNIRTDAPLRKPIRNGSQQPDRLQTRMHRQRQLLAREDVVGAPESVRLGECL